MPRLAQRAAVSLVLMGMICVADDLGGQAMYLAGPIGLSARSSTIVLRRAPGADHGVGLRFFLDHLRTGEHLVLIVSDLQTDQPPGAVYDLFFNIPHNVLSKEANRYFVGSINFFGAFPSGRESAENPDKKYRRSRFTSFDVTDMMRGMAKEGDLPEAPSITIIPSGAPAAGSHPVIGRIELVAVSDSQNPHRIPAETGQ